MYVWLFCTGHKSELPHNAMNFLTIELCLQFNGKRVLFSFVEYEIKSVKRQCDSRTSHIAQVRRLQLLTSSCKC